MSEKEDANLAKNLKEDERKEIAKKVVAGYRADVRGRRAWEERRDRFYKLWMTQRDKKTTPWPEASNVCLPLLAIACNQFHARSYQAMFTPASFVKCIPVGANDDKRSKSVEAFMNWQLLYEVEDYEDEFDKLLLAVPVNGMAFKKLSWDHENQRPLSQYVSAVDLILPYRTRSLDTARRATHRIYRHYEEMEMVAEKTKRWIDFDKVKPGGSYDENESALEQTRDENEPEELDTNERQNIILEQSVYLKLKDDKTAAPYLATVDLSSETLLRLVSRVVKSRGTEVVFNNYIEYGFFPNIEGFYNFGFGHFLEQLNEMANTAFNQIFDSGRLSNQPFGFYGRRAGLRKKEIKLHPGLMSEVQDVSQVYFPQMQRVDQVLFQVLGLIEQYTQQFTSTGDYLLGRESRGTKTPTASGTLAIIEQGLVLYNTMIKRLYRSLKKEFNQIAFLNQIHLPEKKQYMVMEDVDNIAFPEARRADFDARMHIIPVGDPSYASKLTRRQEAQEIYTAILNNPLVVETGKIQIKNERAVYEATKALLETYDRKDLKKLLPPMKEEIRQPEEENAMFFQGDYVDPVDGEDVIYHLEVHERFKKSELYKQMDAEDKKLLDKHLKATKALVYKSMKAANNLGAPVEAPAQSPEMDAGLQPGIPQTPVPVQPAPGPEAMAVNPAEAMNASGIV